MKNQIIIHSAGEQVRTALIENGEIAQLFIESPENQRTVGDIYVSEVHKVMRGIRAAFIDMGTPKDAFLHFSDTGEHLDDYIVMLNGKESIPKWFDENPKATGPENPKNNNNGRDLSSADEQNRMGALLQPKQKLLVQIVKEPIGSKGPRVSTNISIAGRFLVLMPMGDYVAVSKRIRSYKERRRLRGTVASILPEGFGVIVRTVADGQKDEALQEDLKDVLDKWNNILEKLNTAKPPTLLHRDMDMTESLIRDLFAKDYDRVLIDDAKLYKNIKNYVAKVAPSMVPQIEFYKGSEHIFDYMKISQDVDSVFSPRVKMPSGGYLIFEQTEAMYVVDVNSGRYAAKKAQEDNSLKTNLEAAREIAKQLRLRDIGGIIVVDFIDLREDNNRKKVYDELKKEFRKDRAKTNVLPMSDFGLVQITRQRIRPSVVKSVSKSCPMCGGSGQLVTQNTIIADLETWLTKFRYTYKYRSVDLYVNQYMESMLNTGLINKRLKWMFRYWMRININRDDTISMNDFKFTLSGSDVDITETVLNDEPIEKAIKQTEQSIAEMASEQKSDATKLDVYKRDKSSKAGSGRSADHRRDNDKNQPQSSSKPKPKPAEKKKESKPEEEPKSKEQDSRQDKTSSKQQAPRKGKVNSRYYKSGDQEQDQNQKAETKEAPVKDQQPEEKLPSALEVAMAYKKKMEAEAADNASVAEQIATVAAKAESNPDDANLSKAEVKVEQALEEIARDAGDDGNGNDKVTKNVKKKPSAKEKKKDEKSEEKATSQVEEKPAPKKRGRPPKKKADDSSGDK